jgi:hypothetical protein
MGTWTAAVYNTEQMSRLNVDKYGEAAAPAPAVREEVKMFGGKAGCAPTWLTSGIEAPIG